MTANDGHRGGLVLISRILGIKILLNARYWDVLEDVANRAVWIGTLSFTVSSIWGDFLIKSGLVPHILICGLFTRVIELSFAPNFSLASFRLLVHPVGVRRGKRGAAAVSAIRAVALGGAIHVSFLLLLLAVASEGGGTQVIFARKSEWADLAAAGAL